MYTIGPLTTSNFMGWVVKGKESPSRWGPTLQNFSKIIPVFLGRISLFWLISDKLLIIDICKSFVKERRSTPSNLRLGKTLKKWLWHYPPPPPTILPRFVEIGIGKPCQTGRLVGPINNFFQNSSQWVDCQETESKQGFKHRVCPLHFTSWHTTDWHTTLIS